MAADDVEPAGRCYRCGRPIEEDDRELITYPERIDDDEFEICMPCSAELDLWLNTPPPVTMKS